MLLLFTFFSLVLSRFRKNELGHCFLLKWIEKKRSVRCWNVAISKKTIIKIMA